MTQEGAGPVPPLLLAAVRGHQADIMATKPVPPRPQPRLYLATPELDDPSALIASLPGLLAKADVAAVLVRLKPTDQRTMISRVKALAPAVRPDTFDGPLVNMLVHGGSGLVERVRDYLSGHGRAYPPAR